MTSYYFSVRARMQFLLYQNTTTLQAGELSKETNPKKNGRRVFALSRRDGGWCNWVLTTHMNTFLLSQENIQHAHSRIIFHGNAVPVSRFFSLKMSSC